MLDFIRVANDEGASTYGGLRLDLETVHFIR